MSYPPGCLRRASFNEPFVKSVPRAAREGERRAGPAAGTPRSAAANVSRYPTTQCHNNRRGGTAAEVVGHLVHKDTGAHTGPVPESRLGCVCQCVRTACTHALSVFKVLNTLSTKFLVSRGRQNLGRGVTEYSTTHARSTTMSRTTRPCSDQTSQACLLA